MNHTDPNIVTDLLLTSSTRDNIEQNFSIGRLWSKGFQEDLSCKKVTFLALALFATITILPLLVEQGVSFYRTCFPPTTQVIQTQDVNHPTEPVVQTQDVTKFIEFYKNGKKNACNVTLDTIMEYTPEQKEAQHQYIQYLFPIDTKSKYNSQAPCVDFSMRKAFLEDPILLNQLKKSFEFMLCHYGLKLEGNCQEGYKVVPDQASFSNMTDRWMSIGTGIGTESHNALRITRILRSLRLLGRDDLAKPFFTFLQEYNAGTFQDEPAVTSQSYVSNFWSKVWDPSENGLNRFINSLKLFVWCVTVLPLVCDLIINSYLSSSSQETKIQSHTMRHWNRAMTSPIPWSLIHEITTHDGAKIQSKETIPDEKRFGISTTTEKKAKEILAQNPEQQLPLTLGKMLQSTGQAKKNLTLSTKLGRDLTLFADHPRNEEEKHLALGSREYLLAKEIKMDFDHKWNPYLSEQKPFSVIHGAAPNIGESQGTKDYEKYATHLQKLDEKKYLADISHDFQRMLRIQKDSGAKECVWFPYGMGAFLRNLHLNDSSYRDPNKMFALRTKIAQTFVQTSQELDIQDLHIHLCLPNLDSESNSNYRAFLQALSEYNETSAITNITVWENTDATTLAQNLATAGKHVSLANGANKNRLGNHWDKRGTKTAIDENFHRRSSDAAVQSLQVRACNHDTMHEHLEKMLGATVVVTHDSFLRDLQEIQKNISGSANSNHNSFSFEPEPEQDTDTDTDTLNELISAFKNGSFIQQNFQEKTVSIGYSILLLKDYDLTTLQGQNDFLQTLRKVSEPTYIEENKVRKNRIGIKIQEILTKNASSHCIEHQLLTLFSNNINSSVIFNQKFQFKIGKQSFTFETGESCITERMERELEKLETAINEQLDLYTQGVQLGKEYFLPSHQLKPVHSTQQSIMNQLIKPGSNQSRSKVFLFQNSCSDQKSLEMLYTNITQACKSDRAEDIAISVMNCLDSAIFVQPQILLSTDTDTDSQDPRIYSASQLQELFLHSLKEHSIGLKLSEEEISKKLGYSYVINLSNDLITVICKNPYLLKTESPTDLKTLRDVTLTITFPTHPNSDQPLEHQCTGKFTITERNHTNQGSDLFSLETLESCLQHKNQEEVRRATAEQMSLAEKAVFRTSVSLRSSFVEKN